VGHLLSFSRWAAPARGQAGHEGVTDGVPRRKRRLGSEQRRALRLLASGPFGATEAIMLAQGFKRRMLADLARA
jgi:hypothetical protein